MPYRRLPRHRVRYLRLRVRLRLHPGHGHATVAELWLRWGRLAAFRRSAPDPPVADALASASSARPALLHPDRPRPLPARAAPAARRARRRHQPAARRQDRLARLGHPALPRPGAVDHHQARRVRADLRRPRRPRPGARVQPAGRRRRAVARSGGTRSTAARTPPSRSAAPTRSPSRSASRASRTPPSGPPRPATTCAPTSTPPPWPAWTCGTSPAGSPAPATTEAEDDPLPAYPGAAHHLAAQLAEMRGEANKTISTVRMTMSRALAFLADPALAAAVLPGPGQSLDIPAFLRRGRDACT